MGISKSVWDILPHDAYLITSVKILKQVCIPVQCVPPTGWPYLQGRGGICHLFSHLWWGGFAFWQGSACPWHCGKADPLPVERMTYASKNSTLSHTSYAGGNNFNLSTALSSHKLLSFMEIECVNNFCRAQLTSCSSIWTEESVRLTHGGWRHRTTCCWWTWMSCATSAFCRTTVGCTDTTMLDGLSWKQRITISSIFCWSFSTQTLASYSGTLAFSTSLSTCSPWSHTKRFSLSLIPL